MKTLTYQRRLQIAAVVLVISVMSIFIAYDRALAHRKQQELADLQNLFDGNNTYQLTYQRHTNADIPQVIGGIRSSRMSLPEEKGTLVLQTAFFPLNKPGPVTISESQTAELKQQVLNRLCQSLMLNAYNDPASTIVVDVKAVSGAYSAQVLNLRASIRRCIRDRQSMQV